MTNELAADIADEFGRGMPANRFVNVDGTPENALLAVHPGEVVDLVERVLTGQTASQQMAAAADEQPAVPTVAVVETPDGPRVLVRWPTGVTLVSGLCSDDDTAAVQAFRVREVLAPLGEVEQLRQQLTRAQALSSGDPAAVAELRAENERLTASLATESGHVARLAAANRGAAELLDQRDAELTELRAVQQRLREIRGRWAGHPDQTITRMVSRLLGEDPDNDDERTPDVAP